MAGEVLAIRKKIVRICAKKINFPLVLPRYEFKFVVIYQTR